MNFWPNKGIVHWRKIDSKYRNIVWLPTNLIGFSMFLIISKRLFSGFSFLLLAPVCWYLPIHLSFFLFGRRVMIKIKKRMKKYYLIIQQRLFIMILTIVLFCILWYQSVRYRFCYLQLLFRARIKYKISKNLSLNWKNLDT